MCRPVPDNFCSDIWAVRDYSVHSPIQQPPNVLRIIDGPHLNGDTGFVCDTYKPGRHDSRDAARFRHLKRAVWPSDRRDVYPRTIEGHAHFEATGTSGHCRIQRTRRCQRPDTERPKADMIRCACHSDVVNHRAYQLLSRFLQFDNEPGIPITIEHLAKRGHVEGRQLDGGVIAHPSSAAIGAAQHSIVVDDGTAVAGETHIELEAVGAGGEPAVEPFNRVFRADLAAAPVSKNERPR